MHSLFVPLESICKENVTQNKILIMPSYLDGNTLKKSLSREGFSALNLNITTLFDLARDYCVNFILRRELKILDYSTGQIFILQILKKISGKSPLNYFQPSLFSPGIIRTIYLTIKELRVAGYSSRNFPFSVITNPQKRADLFKIMKEYEKTLEEHKYIDEADIYLQAISCEKSNQLNNVLFIIPSNIEFNYLEEVFFRKMIWQKSKVIPFPSPRNLKKPGSFYFPGSIKEKDDNRGKPHAIDYLYNIGEMPPDLAGKIKIDIIQTNGEYNEVKGIIRKIKSQNIPLDEVSIFYTAQEPYSQYLYQLSRQYSFPITFDNGISIKNSSPAKVLLSLIDWIRDDYSVGKFYALLTGGDFQFKNRQSISEIPPPQRVASLLRQSPIGHKRDRYIEGLDGRIKQLKNEIEQVSENRKEGYREKVKELSQIKEFVKHIFQELPRENFDYTISPKEMTQGLIKIMSDYSKIDEDNHLDNESLSRIKEKLAVFNEKDALLPDMTVNEIFTLITELIKNERIGCSEPREGFLHVASYKKGLWLNRPHVFIVGMDAAKFPDSVHSSSILLDSEKMMTGRIHASKGKEKENQYKMLQLLSSLEGRIALLYSRFDTQSHRELAPASLMLQLFRLKVGDEQKDYSDFYSSFSDTSGFIPGSSSEILDSADWFLYSNSHHASDMTLICNHLYPELAKGLFAGQQREKTELNQFNGKIKVAPDRVDPRLNRGLVMSSSRLELIAVCPYLYFLKYILKINPPEEMIEEKGIWLDSSEKGILLHQIFEDFYKKLKEISPVGTFVLPSYTRYWPILEDIVRCQLKKKKQRLAPPNKLVEKLESKEILDSCKFFLHCEEKKYKGEIPTYFEFAFGTRDNQNEELGRKIKAIELSLPGGKSISFQGKIDRIDKYDADTFRIIDYKTGTPRDYSHRQYFRNGKQIQHALYALSLKKILIKAGISNSPKIPQSGYYFPTLQGQGRQYFYGEEKREQVLEVIDLLMDIVSQGNFAMTQKADHFMCSDYRDILEQNQMMEITGRNAKKYQEETALDYLRRLQEDYE